MSASKIPVRDSALSGICALKEIDKFSPPAEPEHNRQGGENTRPDRTGKA